MKNVYRKCIGLLIVFIILLSGCGGVASDNGSEELRSRLETAQAELEEARSTISWLYGQYTDEKASVEELLLVTQQQEELIASLNEKYGGMEVINNGFRMYAQLEELDMRQAITCPDKNDPESGFRVYDMPSYYGSAYSNYTSNTYVEVHAKLSVASTSEENYGEESIWYLVSDGGHISSGGICNVYWVPASSLVEYTSENMHTITGGLQLREGAVASTNADMKDPEIYDESTVPPLEIYLLEQYDNGMSLISFSGLNAAYYVYTSDLVWPEPVA